MTPATLLACMFRFPLLYACAYWLWQQQLYVVVSGWTDSKERPEEEGS
jgi:hypothetical protein